MEDDDEIRSQQSHGSGSRSPVTPSSNGRITVTVAAAPPLPPPQNILAFPSQHTQTKASGGGREDCWSEGATAVLIDAWGERYLELSRGNLKQKHWKEVADIVSSREDYTKPPKTEIQCKNRIDTVKKKYKLEKGKISTGGGPSNWPFFQRLDELIDTRKAASSVATMAITTGNHKVPMGIPVGVRAVGQFQQQNNQQQNRQKQQFRRKPPTYSDSSESEPKLSPPSADSFPPGTFERKRPRIQKELNSIPVQPKQRINNNKTQGVGRPKNCGNSVKELTRAILKFGDAYERAEDSKLQQMVEMEKQRMKLAKELELQRMQFFMKTQLELSQSRKHKKVVGNHHHRISYNSPINTTNNNSDSST